MTLRSAATLKLNQSLSLNLRQPSQAFNTLFIAYARAFNTVTQRTGVLFEIPFGCKIVDNERYFLALITYRTYAKTQVTVTYCR